MKHFLAPVSVLRRASVHEYTLNYARLQKYGKLVLFKYMLWDYCLSIEAKKRLTAKFMEGPYT